MSASSAIDMATALGGLDYFTTRAEWLQTLQFNDGTQLGLLPFLELIKPSPMCSIAFTTTSSPPGNDQESSYDGVQAPPSRFYRALLPWILAYMKGHAPRFIFLEVVESDASFIIHDHPPPSHALYRRSDEYLDITVRLDSFCLSAIAELGASSDIFSPVTHLSICIQDKHDALAPLYKSFTSVTELTLQGDTSGLTAALHAYNEQEQSGILFPRLRSLCVSTYSPSADSAIANVVLDILEFVENRAGAGLPLSSLDLSEGDPRIGLSLSDNDKERLTKLPGLTVKLPSREEQKDGMRLFIWGGGRKGASGSTLGSWTASQSYNRARKSAARLESGCALVWASGTKNFDPLIRLPPELWLEIFMKNTEMDDLSHYRLETARHCSQVCQLWRTILLSSSSTWGRLLVLHEFERTADEWKELMLARVGNALLWIRGWISHSTWKFFLTVVDRYWENVQVFDVWQNTGPRLSPEIAAFLGKPAPNLEVFALEYSGHIYPAPGKPYIQNMFSNFAPRLRRYEISPFLFDVNSTLPWIRNLHTIHFHAEYSKDVIFSVLKAMPRIEFIHINLQPWMDETLPRGFCPSSPSTATSPYFETRRLDVGFVLDSHYHSALANLGAASGSFSSVEQLLVDVGDNHEALIPLYEAFTSVTQLTLEASDMDIPVLHADREQKQSVLFPQLRILRISFEAGALAGTAYLPQVFDYIEYRAKVGLPLSCLDLSDCSPLELSDSNRERLDMLMGLTVKLPVVSAE
ncbi:hypothetical protein CPC08DRAFT_727366 [Agrocybe pediades]|nr:hypothetical protein CPC08DRAFT_727366 [Agrocybe pediades]